MNLALVPMLLLSLLLLASEGADPGVVRLLLSGDHELDATDEAVIVGDATVAVPGDGQHAAPVYIIGGTTRIDGAVRDRVTQIAGTLVVGADAEIVELRHIGGTQAIAADADVARRTGIDGGASRDAPVRSAATGVLAIALLAAGGAWLARTRQRNLDTVTRAVARHPVITGSVGALLTVTALSLFVFMAFTLVLIPVSLLGLLIGLGVAALGVVAWGYRLGRHLPLRRPDVATAVGVAALVVGMQLIGTVPVLGDAVVGFVLLSGIGAVVVTYIGYADFRPAELPD